MFVSVMMIQVCVDHGPFEHVLYISDKYSSIGVTSKKYTNIVVFGHKETKQRRKKTSISYDRSTLAWYFLYDEIVSWFVLKYKERKIYPFHTEWQYETEMEYSSIAYYCVSTFDNMTKRRQFVIKETSSSYTYQKKTILIVFHTWIIRVDASWQSRETKKNINSIRSLYSPIRPLIKQRN